jgi:GMP synthase (glutamine-hydrolysing)
MRVLAFRHSPTEDLGRMEAILQAHGFVYDYADLYRSPTADPPVCPADALIFLGGSMSANDHLHHIDRELQYINSALQRRQPLLGLCLGAQLIAKALGASVYPNGMKEVGWAPVLFTKSARSDAVFHGLDTEVMFHWHGETFDVPDGAELLASSSACRHQAFRWGNNVYGLQFHLEVTPARIAQWCREDEACGEAREAREPIDPYAHCARNAELAGIIFGRWCDVISRRSHSD